MPAEYPVLRDPKHWLRAEFNSFHSLVHAGQRGELDDSSIFQYRIVYPEGQKEPKLCLETMHERDPNSTLKYTRGELLRGTDIAAASPGPGSNPVEHWNGLPLARTSHVYVCFRSDLFKGLLTIHQHHNELRNLLCETARMEQFGPIHVRRACW